MRLSNEMLDALISHAREASTRAYCPYSRFRVGAAVIDEGGAIFSGCNVENASFGLTSCAERNAVFAAVAAGSTRIVAVVIYTPTGAPTAPCGPCRQVINEFGPGAEILSVCDGPERLYRRLAALLPDAFGPRNLR
jgi:cytidine deaminase